MITFSERAVIPSHVLIRFLDQESVLLNLETEKYFGLDAVGTRMWQLVTAAATVEVALAQLVEEYDAPPETLRTDLTKLLQHLLDNGLIELQTTDVGKTSPV
ncbi:MAG TPA: PqqD family protein [Candidatus Acidoferrum sp.]|nr:PqqD family protein [Candidatus Acidoferrum sp.]